MRVTVLVDPAASRVPSELQRSDVSPAEWADATSRTLLEALSHPPETLDLRLRSSLAPGDFPIDQSNATLIFHMDGTYRLTVIGRWGTSHVESRVLPFSTGDVIALSARYLDALGKADANDAVLSKANERLTQRLLSASDEIRALKSTIEAKDLIIARLIDQLDRQLTGLAQTSQNEEPTARKGVLKAIAGVALVLVLDAGVQIAGTEYEYWRFPGADPVGSANAVEELVSHCEFIVGLPDED